jgi:sugar lactone lactonase YvrE
MLDSPYGVAVDTSGNLYIADWFNHRIRKVDTFGTINTIAGTGTASYSGEGVATEQDLQYPRDVSLDTLGNIYIADTDNHRIRKVDTSGMISTVAGNGSQGYNGDGLLAIDAYLSRPRDVVVDSNGHIFLTDESNHRVRMVSAYDGIITTIAGTGTLGFNGHHQRAILSDLSSPRGIAMPAVRGGGQIYFSDCGNNMVRKLGFHVVAELY